MNKATEISMPEEWSDLSAKGTRFELHAHLYEIVHWSQDIRFGKHGSQFSDFCFFFLDDIADGLEPMVGYYFFKDEIPYARRFIEAFEPFADAVPDELSFGPIDKSKINPPSIVLERAEELYEKLLEKGNPKVEQYLK